METGTPAPSLALPHLLSPSLAFSQVRAALHTHKAIIYSAFAYYCGLGACAVATAAINSLSSGQGEDLAAIMTRAAPPTPISP